MENFGLIGLIIVIFGGVGAYFLMGFLKGKVIINLDKQSFHIGEDITGNCVIIAKKDIEVNSIELYVRGYEETERYDDDEDKYKTHTRKIFERKKRLSDSEVLKSGSQKDISFDIQAPTNENDLDNSISSIMSMITDTHKKVKWEVYLSVDAKGVDLSTTERIYIDR